MKEFKLGSNLQENLLKVIVNDDGDAIYINPADTSFIGRYSAFLAWLDEKSAELSAKGDELSQRYEGKPLFVEDADGDLESIDSEQLVVLAKLMTSTYEEIAERIDGLFGQDTLKKYFKHFYEINPDFLPDEECINDFLEAISPAIDAAYGMRAEALKKKYNKRRKGATAKHNKSKDELIKEYKMSRETAKENAVIEGNFGGDEA